VFLAWICYSEWNYWYTITKIINLLKLPMYALDIQKLYKTYASGVVALKGISLQVKKGDFFALLGANGAGKSTVIGLIATLLTKTSGSISIHGYNLERQPDQAKSCLGLVPQEINLNIFETCEQILLNQAGYFGVERKRASKYAKVLLNELGLWEKRTSIVRHLSGGMKRRLMIARALIHKPLVLILDEPTAGVDIEIRRSMWSFLKQINEQGTTIILTTHYLEEAEQLCKNIAIIDKGLILENTSMSALLQSLRHQTFVFNTVEPLDVLPSLEPLVGMKIDANSFELRIDNNLTLNQVFEILNKKGLRIQSMRNKTNRLEELFMDIIHDDN
jgi:ABC-2 type transport system ATP-binding protein